MNSSREAIIHPSFPFVQEHMREFPSAAKTIALVRILTAIISSSSDSTALHPSLAHGGFEQYVSGFVQSQAVGFYKGFLSAVVLPHPVLFGTWSVLSTSSRCHVRRLWVRSLPSSALAHASLTWPLGGPWPRRPVWQYSGQNSINPLLFLFLIFFMPIPGEPGPRRPPLRFLQIQFPK